MKMCGGVKAKFHTSFTLPLGKNEWSVSYFTPRERVPNTYRIGGQVGSRATLDMVIVKIKIPATSRNLQARPYLVQYCLKCFMT
jgi:hypothetical protein